MVNLSKAFSYFKPFKALVLGDFLFDTYTTWKVKRISPEAPVPVMEVMSQTSRPGGAGNVVLNLQSLGAEVTAVGRLGEDPEGVRLRHSLGLADTNVLLVEPNYKTPVKNRLISDSQQLLRIDFETISPTLEGIEMRVIQELAHLIPTMQVIAISDYGKGFLTERILRYTLDTARKAKVPTVVDPKGIEFNKYRGAYILKPNLGEAYAAARCLPSVSLDEVASHLLQYTDCLLITRSEAGITIFEGLQKRSDFPVRSKEVKDVTGAGDTVLAVICLGVANGLDIQQSAELANIAAGLSIERVGCVQITLSELAERLLTVDSGTKIFNESHSYALHQVLRKKLYTLLVLEKGQTMTNGLFRTIRKLSHRESALIIYIQDTHPDDEFTHLLASLHEVNCIILQTESLQNLCSTIHPHAVYRLQEDCPVLFQSAANLLELLAMQEKREDPTSLGDLIMAPPKQSFPS